MKLKSAPSSERSKAYSGGLAGIGGLNSEASLLMLEFDPTTESLAPFNLNVAAYEML